MFYNPWHNWSGILVLRDFFFFLSGRFLCGDADMTGVLLCYQRLWNVELCKQKCTCKYFCTCPPRLGSLCCFGHCVFMVLIQVGIALLKSWMATTSGLFMIHMISAYEASLFSFTGLWILEACFYHAEFAKTQAVNWRIFLQSTLSS